MNTHCYIPRQKGLLELLFVLIVIAHSFSIQGQNIVNPNHQFEENFEREYEDQFELFPSNETINSSEFAFDKSLFRNEINGTIWVRDSIHGFNLTPNESYRYLVLTRNKDGFPTHEINWTKIGFNNDGVWNRSSQKMTKYNTFNNPEEVLYQEWSNTKKQWINNYILTTKYNLNNKFTHFNWLDWDEQSSAWLNRREAVQEYNSSGDVVYNKSREWDKKLSKWDSYYIRNYKYNSSLLIEVISESYDTKNSPDIRFRKQEYDYNSSGLIIKENKFSQDSFSNWVLKNIRTKAYNSVDSLIFEEYSYWNTPRSVFLINSQKIYVYDIHNNLIENVYRKLDRNTGILFDLYHEHNTYDNRNYLIKCKTINEWIDDTLERSVGINYYVNNDIGKPIYHLLQVWDNIDSVWDNRLQHFYKYDINNYRIENLSTNWNSVDSIWDKSRLTTNNYDEYGHELSYSYSEYRDIAWKEIDNSQSFWSEFELTSIEDKEIYLNIYPNPVNDQLFIEMDDGYEIISVILFDQMGKVLITKFNNQALDVSSILPGTYYIHINTTNGSVTRKIVKQ